MSALNCSEAANPAWPNFSVKSDPSPNKAWAQWAEGQFLGLPLEGQSRRRSCRPSAVGGQIALESQMGNLRTASRVQPRCCSHPRMHDQRGRLPWELLLGIRRKHASPRKKARNCVCMLPGYMHHFEDNSTSGYGERSTPVSREDKSKVDRDGYQDLEVVMGWDTGVLELEHSSALPALWALTGSLFVSGRRERALRFAFPSELDTDELSES
jgi:hypothetical protein